MRRLIVGLAALVILFGTAQVHASFWGPSPYLQFPDSPFSGQTFGYFHLEDFEDGLLNTPGVSASAGAPQAPGAFTDSVDADDGLIDGLGIAGRSFYSGFVGQNTPISITFTFEEAILGTLPTHVGIVWTDVGWGSHPTAAKSGDVTFVAADQNNVPFGQIGPVHLGDGDDKGGTAEDRFFGATWAGGIKSFTISMDSGDWETDHLQYGGAVVPEPSTLAIWSLLGLCGFGLYRRRKA